MLRRSLLMLAAAAALVAAGGPAAAQNSAPQPVPLPAPVVAEDRAWPGLLRLEVDATDLDRRIIELRQTIPLSGAGGDLRLHYPQWIPGNHAPRGPIYNYAGVRFSAAGAPVAWRRDPADVYTFIVQTPAGADELVVEADFLTPTEPAHGPIAVTREMMRLNWYAFALYPAGHFIRRIDIEASLRLPAGWEFGTALETAPAQGRAAADGWVRFAPVSFETLVDSPVFAGKHFRKIDLDPGGRSRVTLNVMADEPGQLAASEEALAAHRALIDETDALFGGARHFDHYDFLLSLSDRLATAGIEHHRSSSNGVTPRYFTAWDEQLISRDLLAHEYVHSWNGKFRRPAELWTPTLNTPMRDSLLWVYEGLTQYWGVVLAARSGFLTREQALDTLASTAATFEVRRGRDWRPLADTTHDPIIAARRALPWPNWQRSEDYYSEGLLIWLDADTLIRERSRGRRSLDDFAEAFFGMRDGDWGQLTYTFEDVVAVLNAVEPYDWAAFFTERVDEVRPEPPLDGLARGGYRLVYTDAPHAVWRDSETRLRRADLTHSIGAVVDAGGKLGGLVWEGPAFNAGLTSAAIVTAVNDRAFSLDVLRAEVAATADGRPLELLIKENDVYRRVAIAWTGGLRYPRLERADGRAYLDEALRARR
jgi:predicted metalloprotease with PDZ domain